ncbi:MAG: helix-turn-helix transcriptional regulator [Bacilli bacterium]|nr:helix-turn-helix transcriptional regulator [Bacilli bacterium]
MNELQKQKEVLDLEYDLICDFIKLRTELGISQKQMANEAGVVREMIAVIENRRKHPQINTLLKILKPLGYTLKIVKIEEEKNEVYSNTFQQANDI